MCWRIRFPAIRIGNMPELGVKGKPNSVEFVLVSALKSISSSPSLVPQGQQLHCYVIKSGLVSNVFLQNSLLSMYSKMGLLSSAKSIFDYSLKLDLVSNNIMLGGYVRQGLLNDAYELFLKMPARNTVSYTTMIMGFAKKEHYEDAIKLFWQMRFSNVFLQEVTLATVVSAYARLNGFGRSGLLFHGLVLKLGFDGSVLVSTNLVLLYCVSSRLAEARMIFNKIVDRNVVSWNVMLNGYVKAEQLELARKLFESIPERDVISWGTMIDGYVQTGMLREALALYCRMRHTGVYPNEVMIVNLIAFCGDEKELVQGKQFHVLAVKMGFNCYDFMQATLIHLYAGCGEVKLAHTVFEEGNKNHITCWNALISGFMRNGLLDESRSLFMEMPERDIFSWSSMISGYTQNGHPDLAIELFVKMVQSGVKPNEITISCVLSAISSSGTLEEGRWVHDYISLNSVPLTDNLSAALIDMYSKCGSISSALEMFNQIEEKAKDISPWNAIICGLAMHGHGEMSLRIFSKLDNRNLNPNSITFIGVLSACCHAGLVELGKEHFRSMKTKYKVDPNIKHYGCMVDLLGRAGRLKEAEELVHSMPMKADVTIWGALLSCCKMHGDTEIGERAARNLAEVEPSHGPSRVLLSNIYADVGRWDEAFLARRVIQLGKLSRSPGYSGIMMWPRF